MTPVRWLEPDEQAAWRVLLRTTLGLVDRLDAELRAEHDLTFGDYEILAHLSSGADGRLRMTDLAGRALVSKSRLTHAIARLEERGLVRREPDEHDGRGVQAALTARGRSLLERAAPTHVDGVRRLLIDQLPEGGVEALVEALEPVRDGLFGPPSP